MVPDPQISHMISRRLLLVLGSIAAIAACERTEQPRPADSIRTGGDTTISAPDSLSEDVDVDWRDENGPVLAVAGDSAGIAILVLPALDTPRTSVEDLDSLRDLEVDLFSTRGHVGSGKLRPRPAPPATGDECAEWPTAQLVQRNASRPARWNVGLATGSAIALAMDSLAGMHQPDSARLAAEIAKLASVMPNDTAPMFRGLPFRVQSAYRVQPTPGVYVVVATVIRTINQEANARTEHLLLIAEQDRNTPGAKLQTRYFERVSGPEESTETVDILAALMVGADERPTIILGRSDDSGTAFALVERTKTGEWILQWSSPYTDC